MKRFILKEKVKVLGLNYWGINSYIEFIPYECNGWYWETPSGILPISHSIAKCKFGRITLCDPNSNYQLNIYEHIGFLRFLGIDNVLIRSSRWPPYDGCSELYYQSIKQYLVKDGEIKWKKVNKNSFGASKERFTNISADEFSSPDLKLNVIAGWHPLETKQRNFFVSKNRNYILSCLEVKAQGYPHNMYYLALILKFFGYNLINNITWSKKYSKDVASELFFQHRVLDLLGGLSLYDHQFLPYCSVLSYFGGHKTDFICF